MEMGGKGAVKNNLKKKNLVNVKRNFYNLTGIERLKPNVPI